MLITESMGLKVAILAVITDDSERGTRAVFTALLNLLLSLKSILRRGWEALDYQLLSLHNMNRNSNCLLISPVA